jgi:DNA-binding XRE family transcriptional regulator
MTWKVTVMLDPTKKPHTDDTVRLCFHGPAEKRQEAIDALRELGFEDASGGDWRDIFPEFEDEPAWSVAMRGARAREGLTQKELAKLTSIPQGQISRMENGKLPIGKQRARRLAEVLDVDYRVFL